MNTRRTLLAAVARPFAKEQYEGGRMQELQKWAIQNGAVWLTVLSSHSTRLDYLEPAKAEAFNHARGGSPSALLIDASGDVGQAEDSCCGKS